MCMYEMMWLVGRCLLAMRTALCARVQPRPHRDCGRQCMYVWCTAAPAAPKTAGCCPPQVAADLALRRSNQTAALEALFELLFRSVGPAAALRGWLVSRRRRQGVPAVHICARKCVGNNLASFYMQSPLPILRWWCCLPHWVLQGAEELFVVGAHASAGWCVPLLTAVG